jgi:hypothetical protein
MDGPTIKKFCAFVRDDMAVHSCFSGNAAAWSSDRIILTYIAYKHVLSQLEPPSFFAAIITQKMKDFFESFSGSQSALSLIRSYFNVRLL